MKDYSISKLITHLLALSLMMFLLLSESFDSRAIAGIIVLETLKTEKVTIKATGEGAPPDDASMSNTQKRMLAKRAATVDGYRKLLEQTKLIQVDSETHLSDHMVTNDSLAAKVSGYIRGAKIVDYRQLEDGSAEVDMEIELGPEFYSQIQPAVTK